MILLLISPARDCGGSVSSYKIHPSSLFPLPSSVFRLPSSLFRLPSSVFPLPSLHPPFYSPTSIILFIPFFVPHPFLAAPLSTHPAPVSTLPPPHSAKLSDAAISFWQMMRSTMDLSRPLNIYLPRIGHASHVCEGEKASLRDTPQVNHLRGTIQLLTEHSSHPGSNTALPSRWDLLQRAASLNVAESSRSCPVADNQVSLLVLVSAFINTPANVKHAFTIINHINHNSVRNIVTR
ncbi:uncharacterized protein N7473_005634 [Penicillium subrubescens]|uniref:uncharacterized protein n=1 Tax=Penicillium subrubescens TaxID=1316194 RepID=UPI0025452C9C|nr:uncharacterized protein N7473_005634 [Penicillium subrubescens]KAJ5896235.1 hypothetical protein N7473_005634 [Penicillium subrubescens]